MMRSNTRRFPISQTIGALALGAFGLLASACGDGRDSTGGATTPTGAVLCEVVFRTDGGDTIGALQVQVTVEPPSSADFVGSGAGVDCSSLATGGLFTANQAPERSLRLGIISLDGIPGSGDLCRCAVRSDDGLVSTDDFSATVLDASTPELTPIAPAPTVTVSSIVCTPASD